MQAQYSTGSAGYYNTDADNICGMFGALSLRGASEQAPSTSTFTQIPPDESSDSEMSDTATMDSGYDSQSSTPAKRLSCAIPAAIPLSAPPIYHDASLGCTALQTIQTHIDWHTGATTPSSLLEAILVHRQAFIAAPREHRTCSKALTQLAFTLEQRKAEGDADTAVALRYESWLVSGWS
ncbi:hypothetical protein GLOTRDRAFT_120358 [Gloeophyllum trabeum ATCC 11539]|uniref:Uncharacterized protein n=1 Tax=Gloeophyllum trabeum (strain ATCC 11539 / FP-39264 / Madison 617) TaxID=670483 RepID=S7QC81_GLOTA|nr:uncharacterized protein GLOTRDRAFT_120358 [Gloeophyllum trabeum ATCC 11539]EPQ56962.1 hypothetical protein GLOTRDRAFT_120358 [Gloeophyllum trabeum ATCC 11539]